MIIVNTDTAIRQFNKYDKKVQDEVMQILDTSALMVETRAKRKLTSDGHIITGRLRSSVHVIKKGDEIPLSLKPLERAVGTNVVYAGYIEFNHDSYLHYANMKERNRLVREIRKTLTK